MTFQPRSTEELALTWPPELDHFSASGYKMAVRCEEQWRQRYVLGKKAAPNLNLLVGGADHAAIEHSMAQKIDSYLDLPLLEVQEQYVAELERRVEDVGGVTEVEFKDVKAKTRKLELLDDAKRDGQTWVGAYHLQASPTVQPVAVEEKFSFELAGVPVPIVGYIDLCTATSIIERKGRGQAKSKPEAEWVIAAELYQLAVARDFEWHITSRTKTPQVLTPTLTPEKRDDLFLPYNINPTRLARQAAMVIQKIGWLYQRYGPDQPWPTSGKLHPWACSYCGYRTECWGWK